MLRCHTSSPKGRGRNLLISNSVAGAKLPASWLANPNVHRLLIPVHLPTPVLPKRLSLSSYGRNFLKWILYQYPIHSSNGKLFGVRLGAQYYSDSPDNKRMKNHCYNFFALIRWLFDNGRKYKSLHLILQWMSMVWL